MSNYELTLLVTIYDTLASHSIESLLATTENSTGLFIISFGGYKIK